MNTQNNVESQWAIYFIIISFQQNSSHFYSSFFFSSKIIKIIKTIKINSFIWMKQYYCFDITSGTNRLTIPFDRLDDFSMTFRVAVNLVNVSSKMSH